jgi:hypothetical protein
VHVRDQNGENNVVGGVRSIPSRDVCQWDATATISNWWDKTGRYFDPVCPMHAPSRRLSAGYGLKQRITQIKQVMGCVWN